MNATLCTGCGLALDCTNVGNDDRIFVIGPEPLCDRLVSVALNYYLNYVGKATVGKISFGHTDLDKVWTQRIPSCIFDKGINPYHHIWITDCMTWYKV